MTSERISFETAVYRRRGKPLEFEVKTATVDDEGEVTIREEVLKVNPLLDMVRMGAALLAMQELGPQLGAYGQAREGGIDALAPAIDAIEKMLPKVRAGIRDCLIPKSRLVWDEIGETVDVLVLGQIITAIAQELSGMDPTVVPSSPSGSSETGITSTAGQQPAA